jgi:hypothetical protein
MTGPLVGARPSGRGGICNVDAANYVTFASYFLKGPTAQWWDTHRQTLPAGTIITWMEFKAAFRARYIPQGVMDRKKREFCNLSQGSKSVEAYQREFLELSRYAEEDIATDARRQEKFREGLNPDIIDCSMLCCYWLICLIQ